MNIHRDLLVSAQDVIHKLAKYYKSRRIRIM